jgi:hypothetical protein
MYLIFRKFPYIQNPTQNVKMIFLSDFDHKTILTTFLLSFLGFNNNYILKFSKSVQFEILLIQIPNFEFEGSFHSVQYDESIHAPDLHIRFFPDEIS